MGWSQRYLADCSSMTQSAIARLESGKHQFTQKTIYALAKSFDMDTLKFVFYLMGVRKEKEQLLMEHNMIQQFAMLYNYARQVTELYDDIIKNEHQILNNIERDRAYYIKEWVLIGHKCYKQEKEIELLKSQLKRV